MARNSPPADEANELQKWLLLPPHDGGILVKVRGRHDVRKATSRAETERHGYFYACELMDL